MKKVIVTSNEILEKYDEIIKNFNSGKNNDHGYYFIETSGIKREYFCLWNFNPLAIHKSENYVCQLTKSFSSSVDKAILILENSTKPILIFNDENVHNDDEKGILIFGKYKGEKIEDVAVKDVQYLIWMINSYYSCGKHLNNSKKVNIMLDIIQCHINFYFDQLTKKNKEESKSEYVGLVGDKVNGLMLSVISSRIYVNEFKSKSCFNEYVNQYVIAKDNNSDNQYILNIRCKKPSTNGNLPEGEKRYSKNDKILIKSAKIMENKEICGIKRTRLGYVIME